MEVLDDGVNPARGSVCGRGSASVTLLFPFLPKILQRKMELKEDHPNENEKRKAIFFLSWLELGSAPVTRVWWRLKDRQRKGELHRGKGERGVP